MRQGRHEALIVAVAAAAALAAAYAGTRLLRARRKRPAHAFDYSDRSGFPKPPEAMRGIARTQVSRPIMA